MTVKQFLNFCKCIQFDTMQQQSSYPCNATHLFKKTCIKNPRLVCIDGTSISIQNHQYVHCAYKGVKPQSGMYATTCNLDPIMVETDSLELDQYGIDDIEDVQKVVNNHGGIDIDATINKMWKQINKNNETN